MTTEEITALYTEIVRANPQIEEVGLLVGVGGAAILLSFGSRACFIPVIDREATLEAVAAFSLATGLHSAVKNRAPECN